MTHRFITALVLLAITALHPAPILHAQPSEKKLTAFVDPIIGTAGEGNTFPGAVVPWGMVSPGPRTSLGAPSGYKFGEPYLYGFAQVHLSGTGCPDLGNVILAPTTGAVKPSVDAYRSKYDEEIAVAGYYKVNLTDYRIKAEMTATARAAYHRYTFTSAGDANMLIDATGGQTPSRGGYVKIVSSTEVEGSNISGGFCGKPVSQAVYFFIRFNKSAARTGTWNDEKLTAFEGGKGGEQSGNKTGAYLTFSASAGEVVEAKVGISYVSINNARMNLEREIPEWNFEKVQTAAADMWDKELSRIKIEGGTDALKTIFYTGLYHMLIHPNIISDVNGDYPVMNSASGPKARVSIGRAEGYTRYSVFSLWDTYRNLHPFLTLVYPERQLDMLKTMTAMSRETGWLPKWELAGSETAVMVGDPATAVIADSYIKGITQFDVRSAYSAMKKAATYAPASPTTSPNPLRPGLAAYLKYGYIPDDEKGADYVWGSVSDALEYGLADWGLSQVATKLGYTADALQFAKQSLFYKNYFDPQTKFLRPKNKDGKFITPFVPEAGGFPGGRGYVEGNAWQYLFFVPHDPTGLATLMGGHDAFVGKLQACFDENQFVMWNEPDMHYPYLFNYFEAEAWRAQKEIRTAMDETFKLGPAGIPGNDDAGTTSAWFVFSAMGFYPTCPASGRYDLGSPLFERVTISLNKNFYTGSEFVIEAGNNPAKNIYIESASMNGALLQKPFITHSELVKGGRLSLAMTPSPAYWDGTVRPPKVVDEPEDVSVIENQTVKLTAGIGGTGPFAMQWQRGGKNIAGATAATYTFKSASKDNKAVLRCIIKTASGEAATREVKVSVAPDITPPKISGIECPLDNPAVMKVMFSEPVGKTAANKSLYVVSGTTVKSAGLAPDAKSVMLGLAGKLDEKTLYTLSVKGVKDLAAKPNTLTAKQTFTLTGDGLAAAYFDRPDLTGKSFTRIDPMIKFDFGDGSPDAEIKRDGFSARWTGAIESPATETFTFYAKSDDGVRLWIGGRQIIDEWREQGPTEFSRTVALEAGKKYEIKLEYFENAGGAMVELQWSSPSVEKQIISKRFLYSKKQFTTLTGDKK